MYDSLHVTPLLTLCRHFISHSCFIVLNIPILRQYNGMRDKIVRENAPIYKILQDTGSKLLLFRKGSPGRSLTEESFHPRIIDCKRGHEQQPFHDEAVTHCSFAQRGLAL